MKLTRPTWTELWRMESKKDFNAAAARLFGNQPVKTTGAVPKPYGADQYQAQLGIDINQYGGFFIEVGHAEAATGPVTPATKRLPVRPILAIRQSRRGNYYVQALSFAGGLFNRDKTRAWIKTTDYDALLGDDYFDKIEQQIADLVQEAETADPGRPVQVVDLASLSEQERTIFNKVRSGTDFADLSTAERDILTAAMEARQ
ncbi:hypothetical protein LCGC14_1662610 [marine sediment metagenome]|uniref:Uncharacterized protein n=1 Tax=marine sediment metagenome TaxID=412755 RepID=A0A0F9HTN2_9ZZZZ